MKTTGRKLTRVMGTAWCAAAFLPLAIFGATQSSGKSYDQQELQFKSHETILQGSALLPKEGKIRAGIVFVHGSGRQTRDLALARKFAAEGIAAFAYDKRGVGKSGGTYEQFKSISETNLNVLADDAVAAADLLGGLKRLRGVPIGFVGFSQGGYIVPLAAEKSAKVKFIGFWSGPVCRVSEEDIYSQYTSDRDFKERPSFAQVQDWREKPYVWSAEFGKDIDPGESLSRLNIPGFWIFGKNDGSIPVDLSRERLEKLQAEGKSQFEYVVFSGLGHGTITETFPTMASWIKRAAKNSTNPARSMPMDDELKSYEGTYRSANPELSFTFVVNEGSLTVQSPEKSHELKPLGGRSFYVHDQGSGYVFFDFDPAARTLTGTQNGTSYELRKAAE
jgi:pimeloyl-ACP methyl ester carboxylesterase